MENEIDPQAQSRVEEQLKDKNRYEKLSEKVILTSKEKEAEAEGRKKAEAERDSANKERDFYKDFSANVPKYPAASEYQDKILEKVKAGYATEDAIVSVLAKEGKLNSQPQQNVQVEGGSAPTTHEGSKSSQDMNTEERFAALSELEKSGDLVNALLGK